VTEVPSH